MMHSRWLLRLRGALRSLGVLSAIRSVTTWPDRRRHAARRAEYEKTKPEAIDLPGTPVPVTFHPIDADHYADLMTPREPAVMRDRGPRKARGDGLGSRIERGLLHDDHG